MGILEQTPSAGMEREAELEQCLGEENFWMLIGEVRDGKVKKEHLKLMAQKMSTPVHGVFEEKVAKEIELDFVLRFMLDKWYSEVLHNPEVHGPTELIALLQHRSVNLKEVAQKMNKDEVPLSTPEECPQQPAACPRADPSHQDHPPRPATQPITNSGIAFVNNNGAITTGNVNISTN